VDGNHSDDEATAGYRRTRFPIVTNSLGHRMKSPGTLQKAQESERMRRRVGDHPRVKPVPPSLNPSPPHARLWRAPRISPAQRFGDPQHAVSPLRAREPRGHEVLRAMRGPPRGRVPRLWNGQPTRPSILRSVRGSALAGRAGEGRRTRVLHPETPRGAWCVSTWFRDDGANRSCRDRRHAEVRYRSRATTTAVR
jgi:hypothetical protein